jgi:hypothetical protein
MNSGTAARLGNSIATLQRLARRPEEAEVCEFCSVGLPGAHRHVLETDRRRIVCACDGCALRFYNVVGRWKLIPRDARLLLGFQMSDAQWDSLSLPIQLAFFVQSTPAGRIVALYPSPAGATESSMTVSNWAGIIEANRMLADMQPDVEALLTNRLNDQREYFLAPIDTCFELVGLIRLHWRGFSGGDEVWRQIDAFFCRLRDNSAPAAASRIEVGHA